MSFKNIKLEIKTWFSKNTNVSPPADSLKKKLWTNSKTYTNLDCLAH